ncbi:MAG: indolepyruvate ferredoxin oxidoreductase [Proteobacteria bacterium]|nr:MAG: indolepyruvate ferredoxin oxidoreductase [Pseudomonadota bacterium]
MRSELLLGDEAIAVAALDAGIAGAFAYPGTPSTEIFECVDQRTRGDDTVSARWSSNEKVAYEEALGMSFAGKRALVSMKHVGLNVASDPLMSSALTGVNGAMVLVVADDPGMHSSQSEQDTRFYSDFAKLPLFEPRDQQQCYDMTREAFELSDRVRLPVMVRVVTRIAHSRAVVQRAEPRGQLPPPADADERTSVKRWALIPANARERYAHLLALQSELVAYAEGSDYNELRIAGARGVICSGVANNYVDEALGGREDDSLLRVGVYPLPVAKIRELVDHCDEIVVVEEGQPFIEPRLGGILGIPGKHVRGKLTGDVPATGELTPDSVAEALGAPTRPRFGVQSDLPGRPPGLCRGCPHGDTFGALVAATKDYERPILFSDIGCYTLGVLPPYEAVHSAVDMGASVAMATGAARAGAHPVVCTIGDSTFTHSGMTGLIGAARADANMTVLILDNSTVAMTGAQETMAHGDELVRVIAGLGVDERHLHVFEPRPKRHQELVALLQREIAHPGLSVVVSQRACVHAKRRHKERRQAATTGAC